MVRGRVPAARSRAWSRSLIQTWIPMDQYDGCPSPSSARHSNLDNGCRSFWFVYFLGLFSVERRVGNFAKFSAFGF